MGTDTIDSIEFNGRVFKYVFRPSAPENPLLVVLHGHNKNPRPSKLRSENFNVLCPIDDFGLNGCGSWFLGENGDFFWIDAMKEMISKVHGRGDIYFIGSSMGGYGAILHGIKNNAVGVYANIPQTKLLNSSYSTQGMRRYFGYVFGENITSAYNDLKKIISPNLNTYFDITGIRWDKDGYLKEQLLDFVACLTDNCVDFSFEIINAQGHGLVMPLHEAATRLLQRTKVSPANILRENDAPPPSADVAVKVVSQNIPLKEHGGFSFGSATDEAKIMSVQRDQVEIGIGLSYIDPHDYNLNGRLRFCVLDRKEKKYLKLLTLNDGEVVKFSDDLCSAHRYFRFDSIDNGRWVARTRYFPFMPNRFKGDMDGVELNSISGQKYSIRNDVVISPYRSLKSGGIPIGVRSVYSESRFVPEALRFALTKQMDLPGRNIEAVDHIDGTVIFAGLQNKGFGHFLTEGLSRLWLAKSFPDLPVVWIGRSPLSRMQKDLLNILGITNRSIILDKPTHFSRVIFPFPGVVLGDYFNFEHSQFLGVYDSMVVASCTNQPSHSKVFLSRTLLTDGRGNSIFDHSVDRLMSSFGFKIFYPEQHSITEQLEVMTQAEVVCGVEGSAMHLPLLMRDPIKTNFVAIARHRRGAGIFEHIKRVKKLNYETFDFSGDSSFSRSASDSLSLNFQILEDALTRSSGFEDLASINQYRCDPVCESVSFDSLLRHSRVFCYQDEIDLI